MYTHAASFYKLGRQNILQRLGLADEDHTARNIAVGGAMAAPFAGLIGEKPITKDPYTNTKITRKSLKNLEKMVQPGDIVVTSDPGMSGWKLFQSPTGSSFYHAFSVPGMNPDAGHAALLNAGDLFNNGEPLGQSAKSILRETDTLRDALAAKGYQDAVLLRPKEPLSPQQMQELQKLLIERAQQPYNLGLGARAIAYDMFVPKIPGLEKLRPTCQGDVCSTLPAQAEKIVRGTDIVKGKPAKYVLSADFLRKGSPFSPVAATIKGSPATTPRMQKLLRYGPRAAVGLGLGAATYGLSEDPTLAAAPVGFVAAPEIARRLSQVAETRKIKRMAAKNVAKYKDVGALEEALEAAKQTGHNKFRPLRQLVNAIGNKDLKQVARIKNITRRTLPLAVAGSLGTYATAKGIEHLIRD